LSDIQRENEHLLEEIERLKRQHHQFSIINQEKDVLLERMELLNNEKNALESQLSELESVMKAASDTNDTNKSVLDASHSDLKDLHIQLERYEKSKINLEI
jgi:predicted nuclease with TOPRIM domain